MSLEKRKILYNAISSDYDVGTFEDFDQRIDDPNKRKLLYNTISNDYELGSYDEFNKSLMSEKIKDKVLEMIDSPQAEARAINPEGYQYPPAGIFDPVDAPASSTEVEKILKYEEDPTALGELKGGLASSALRAVGNVGGSFFNMLGTITPGQKATFTGYPMPGIIPEGQKPIVDVSSEEAEKLTKQDPIYQIGNDITDYTKKILEENPQWQTKLDEPLGLNNFYQLPQLARLVGEQVPNLIATMGATVAGAVATGGNPIAGIASGMAVSGLLEGGSAYQTAKEYGKLTPEEQRRVGVLVGGINGLITGIPGAKILDNLGIKKKVVGEVGKKIVEKGLYKEVAKDALEQGVAESFEETLQELVNVYTELSYMDDIDDEKVKDEILERITASALGGFILGGGLGGGASAYKSRIDNFTEAVENGTPLQLTEGVGVEEDTMKPVTGFIPVDRTNQEQKFADVKGEVPESLNEVHQANATNPNTDDLSIEFSDEVRYITGTAEEISQQTNGDYTPGYIRDNLELIKKGEDGYVEGQETYRGEIYAQHDENREGGSATISSRSSVEDYLEDAVVEHVYKRIKSENPGLLQKIKDWTRSVERIAIDEGIDNLPSGIELFAKTYIFGRLGYADANPEIAELLVIPEDIVTEFDSYVGATRDGQVDLTPFKGTSEKTAIRLPSGKKQSEPQQENAPPKEKPKPLAIGDKVEITYKNRQYTAKVSTSPINGKIGVQVQNLKRNGQVAGRDLTLPINLVAKIETTAGLKKFQDSLNTLPKEERKQAQANAREFDDLLFENDQVLLGEEFEEFSYLNPQADNKTNRASYIQALRDKASQLLNIDEDFDLPAVRHNYIQQLKDIIANPESIQRPEQVSLEDELDGLDISFSIKNPKYEETEEGDTVEYVDEEQGVVFIGGDAVSVDMEGNEYPSGYRYPEKEIKKGSGWALSKAGATKLEDLANKGYSTIAVVVYPNLQKAMKFNPIYQEALKRDIYEKHGKRAGNKFIKEGQKVYDAKPDKNKKTTTPLQESAKLAKVSLIGTARKVGESEFASTGGMIVGVGKFAGKRLGDDRIVKHEVYPAEVLMSSYQRLPKPIKFQDFIQKVDMTENRRLGAWMMLRDLNFWLNKPQSKLIPKLIEAGEGDMSILQEEADKGITSYSIKKPAFKSKLTEATEKLGKRYPQKSVKARSLKKFLLNNGVTQEEMDFSGFDVLVEQYKPTDSIPISKIKGHFKLYETNFSPMPIEETESVERTVYVVETYGEHLESFPTAFDANLALNESIDHAIEDIIEEVRRENSYEYEIRETSEGVFEPFKNGDEDPIMPLGRDQKPDYEDAIGTLESWLRNEYTENGDDYGFYVREETRGNDEYEPDDEGGYLKYEEWTLLGGNNYQEIPVIWETGDSDGKVRSHFDGHPNEESILYHIRTKDRVSSDGKRVLFIEEVQSDWHKDGYEKGYKSDYIEETGSITYGKQPKGSKLAGIVDVDSLESYMSEKNVKYGQPEDSPVKIKKIYYPKISKKLLKNQGKTFQIDSFVIEAEYGDKTVYQLLKQTKTNYTAHSSDYSKLENKSMYKMIDIGIYSKDPTSVGLETLLERMHRNVEDRLGLVPDAPGKGFNWMSQALKLALKMASDGNYDAVAFPNGRQVADIYNARKQIDRIKYKEIGKSDDGEKLFNLTFQKNNAILDAGVLTASNVTVPGLRGAVTLDMIEDKLGFKVAQKIENGVKDETDIDTSYGVSFAERMNVLNDLNLEVGGEMHKLAYDNQLPNRLKKLVGKTSQIEFDLFDESKTTSAVQVGNQLAVYMTPELKSKFGEPQSSFSIKKPHKFKNKEIEERFSQAEKGITKDSFIVRAKESTGRFFKGFVRKYIDLPRSGRFAQAYNTLRKYEAQQDSSDLKAERLIDSLISSFSKDEFKLFQRAVIMNDLKRDFDSGKPLPFGFDKDTFMDEFNALDEQVTPRVYDKIVQRQKVIQSMLKQLVDAGILNEDLLNEDPNYFHHQVLEYSKMREGSSSMSELKKPKPGYGKKRKGTELDINANYLQAEFAYLKQAYNDLATVKAIDEIADNYDIKDTLVDKDDIPESYVEWQPDKGNVFFMGNTISERALHDFLDSIDLGVDIDIKNILLDGVKPGLIKGGKKKSIVIPDELAKTLDKLRPDIKDRMLSRALRPITSRWKQWVLTNPRRVIKYNLNNLSGDLDAIISGNASIVFDIKSAKEAFNDFYDAWKNKPSQRYWDALDRGVFDSGFTSNELDELFEIDKFKKFTDRSVGKKIFDVAKFPLKKFWDATTGITRFRENFIRYATYINILKKLEAGKKHNYYATSPKMVEGITDKKDLAGIFTRDLIGDYSNISANGQEIRNSLIPFYSWMEVQFKRYPNLIANAVRGARDTKGRSLLLFPRMALLWGLVNLKNMLDYPDEYEELKDIERTRLELITGRNEDGSIRTIRLQGATSDFFDYFGFTDAIQGIDMINRGQMTYKEMLTEVSLAGTKKVINGLTPVMKLPAELLSNRKFFPDPFDARPIQDKTRHMLKTFSLENEYDWLTGRPNPGYAESWKGTIFYKRNVPQINYYDIKDLTNRYLEKQGREIDGYMTTAKSRVMKMYKMALRYDDKRALKKVKPLMEKHGITEKYIKNNLKNLNPLGGLKSKKDKSDFYQTLNAKDVKRLENAMKFYTDVLNPDADYKSEMGLLGLDVLEGKLQETVDRKKVFRSSMTEKDIDAYEEKYMDLYNKGIIDKDDRNKKRKIQIKARRELRKRER